MATAEPCIYPNICFKTNSVFLNLRANYPASKKNAVFAFNRFVLHTTIVK